MWLFDTQAIRAGCNHTNCKLHDSVQVWTIIKPFWHRKRQIWYEHKAERKARRTESGLWNTIDGHMLYHRLIWVTSTHWFLTRSNVMQTVSEWLTYRQTWTTHSGYNKERGEKTAECIDTINQHEQFARPTTHLVVLPGFDNRLNYHTCTIRDPAADNWCLGNSYSAIGIRSFWQIAIWSQSFGTRQERLLLTSREDILTHRFLAFFWSFLGRRPKCWSVSR